VSFILTLWIKNYYPSTSLMSNLRRELSETEPISYLLGTSLLLIESISFSDASYLSGILLAGARGGQAGSGGAPK
jgi:hypothetical protein